MKRLSRLVALVVAFAMPAHAQTLTKLRVAYDGFSMTSAPLNYADQQGIFKKFGLDVTPIFVEIESRWVEPPARPVKMRVSALTWCTEALSST